MPGIRVSFQLCPSGPDSSRKASFSIALRTSVVVSPKHTRNSVMALPQTLLIIWAVQIHCKRNARAEKVKEKRGAESSAASGGREHTNSGCQEKGKDKKRKRTPN